jgi:hypothetical protein
MGDMVNEKAFLAWQSAKTLKALADPGTAAAPYAPPQDLCHVSNEAIGLRSVSLTPAFLLYWLC